MENWIVFAMSSCDRINIVVANIRVLAFKFRTLMKSIQKAKLDNIIDV
jgi:hypothetical protein